MSLIDVIYSLQTDDGESDGTYLVTRRAAKTPVNGIFVAGASTTLKITAVREPATGSQRVVGGRDQHGVEQGQYVDDVQVLYTDTLLLARTSASDGTPQNDPDLVDILGGTYEVFRVEDWELDGEHTYRAVCTRLNKGAA